MQAKNILALTLSTFSCSAALGTDVVVFENDSEGWQQAATLDGQLSSNVIDFDSIAGSTSTPILGTEFSDSPAGPVFVSIDGNGVFVGNPAPSQVPVPPSGLNMMSPACTPSCEGVIRVTFSEPVIAVGATFVDVEADFASTGFSLDLDASLPASAFTSSQGQGIFSFLGVSSNIAVQAVDIHFATGPNVDGTVIDDLVYVACSADIDSDGDSISDAADNCVLIANSGQEDSDGDGFGNACDADLNNDQIVNVLDLGVLRSVFFTDDANADLNSDGVVNVLDLGIFRQLFFLPPGPACGVSE